MKKIAILIAVCTFYLQAQSFRVEPQTLKNTLNTYTILDTRDNAMFQKNHILGALNLPADKTYQDVKHNGKIAQPSKMVTIIQNLGLHIDDPIVIYDDGSFFKSSRVFWALETYGFKNLKILNHGFRYWTSNSFPTTNQITKSKKSNYILTINDKSFATSFTTLIAIKNPKEVIIDARPNAAYKGEKTTAKRSGHIPGAINKSARENIDKSGKFQTLKSVSSLKNIYKDIDKSKHVIVYCGDGKVSPTSYLAFREMGYNVTNYDASWKEWGNDFSLPVETPTR